MVALVATLLGALVPTARAESVVSMSSMWTRYGTGMVTDIATADVDADGINEIIVGGRGMGVVGPESLDDGRFRWANKWLDADGTPLASDGETVTEFHVTELTGDGAADMIVGSDRALFAIDGRDGGTLWSAIDESSGTAFGAHEVALADLNGDDTPDAAFAELLDERISAVDGRDGSPLWTYPRPLGFVLDLAAGDLNGDGFDDVVVVGQVDVGIEVHAISGLAADRTGIAVPLWVQRFPALPALEEGRPGSIAIAQVDPGLTPEVVVGGNGALAVLDGLTGIARAQRTFEDVSVADILPLQLDDDEQLEIATAAVSFATDPASHSIEVFDSDTTPLWSVATTAPVGEIAAVDLADDARPEVIAGGGWQRFGGVDELDGFVMAIGAPSAAGGQPDIEWDVRLPEDVDSLTIGEAFGDQMIVAGQLGPLGEGDGVFGLDLTGQMQWSFLTGGRIEDVLVSDLDGDSVPEVIEGDSDAHVAVHDRDGALRWDVRVPGKGGPNVQAVAAGNLTSEAGKEIAAGTFEFDPSASDGRLHVYSAAGARLWNRDIAGTVNDVAIADLDRDGVTEVVVAAAAKGIDNPTGIAGRYSSDGGVVWERPAPTGQRTSLSLSDLNADGVDDLVLTRSSVFHGGAVIAIDGATGADLWQVDRPGSVNWAGVTADPADGITAGDLSGTVMRLDSMTGETRWQVDPGSASWGGEWSADVDGDGVRDVLSASHEAKVRMLSGVTGDVLWAADTEGNPGYTVATLGGGTRPLVGVGELGQGTYSKANLLLLDAATGARIGVAPTHGPVLDLAVGNLDDDPVDEFVAAAGWQVVAVDARGMDVPEPTPTATATPEPTEDPAPEASTVAFTERSAASGQYTDETLFEARVADADGDPLPDADITFELAGTDSSRTFNATTDTDGVASVTPKLEEKPGPYQLTVRYAGSAEHAPSSNTTTFVVDREDTALVLSVEGKGNKRTLTARLFDGDTPDAGIAGRTIDFYADGALIGSAITDDNGVATFKPPPRYRGGKHDYVARFEGDDYYTSPTGSEEPR